MARNEEVSASVVPQYLVYLTMAFVLMRFSAFAWQIHSDQVSDNRSSISWMDFNRSLHLDSEKTEKTPTKQRRFGNVQEELLSMATGIIEKQREKERKVRSLTLLQFYSPDSDPCLVMERETMTNSQVADYLQKNYFPVRVTYSRKQVSGAHNSLLTEFRRHYRVCAFPTLVVVDEKGEMVANLVGNCSSLTTYRFLTRTVGRAEARNSNNIRKVALN